MPRKSRRSASVRRASVRREEGGARKTRRSASVRRASVRREEGGARKTRRSASRPASRR